MFPEIKITGIQLDSMLQDTAWMLPEIFISCALVSILLSDLIMGKAFARILPILYSIALLVMIIVDILQIKYHGDSRSLFSGSFLSDRRAGFFKILFDAAALTLIVYGTLKPPHGNTYLFYRKTEFYIILSGILLGLHLLAMASSLLTAYLALEMVSIGGYILATFGFNKDSYEAGIKYLLFGAVASAIMLYGMSLLYGLTGTLHFPEVFMISHPLGFLAVALTLAGVFFKIAASPFHIWAPDVYEGMPAPLAAFFSVAPKAGGFALLIAILSSLFKYPGFDAYFLERYLVLAAAITISVGNFSALWQNNAKRLLAYSSIAHTGFALSALVTLSDTGTIACMYYLAVYLFMNFTAFLIVDFLSESTGSEDVYKFKGLGMQVPVIGVIFVFIMIALTGLPPTAGFYAKFFVFSSLLESYNLTSNILFLLIFLFGLFNTVISLFYYLKIPYLMFFKNAAPDIQIVSSTRTNIYFGILSAPLLVLFLKPDLLLKYINYLFQ